MAEAFFDSISVQKLDTARIEQLKQRFTATDVNKDGRIEKKELYNSMLGEGYAPEVALSWVHSFFQEYDADLNGYVSLDEFINGMSKHPPVSNLPAVKTSKVSLKELQEAFLEADENKDGLLSKEELTNLLIYVGEDIEEAKMHANDCFSLFHAADDDTIEFDHFYQEYRRMREFRLLVALKKRSMEVFSSADKNCDGVLCKDELMDLLREQLGEYEARERFDNIFLSMDTDQNGVVSNKEMYEWYETHVKQSAMESRKKARMRSQLPPIKKRAIPMEFHYKPVVQPFMDDDTSYAQPIVQFNEEEETVSNPVPVAAPVVADPKVKEEVPDVEEEDEKVIETPSTVEVVDEKVIETPSTVEVVDENTEETENAVAAEEKETESEENNEEVVEETEEAAKEEAVEKKENNEEVDEEAAEEEGEEDEAANDEEEADEEQLQEENDEEEADEEQQQEENDEEEADEEQQQEENDEEENDE